MNYPRMIGAAAAATLVFYVYGFLVHGLLIAKDYLPYPDGVYRSGADAQSHMPFGLAGIFLAILMFSAIYARSCRPTGRAAEGARLGLLFGCFIAGAFVAVNYGTIRISGKLALEMAVSEPIEWTLVGLVVGLVYKPVTRT